MHQRQVLVSGKFWALLRLQGHANAFGCKGMRDENAFGILWHLVSCGVFLRAFVGMRHEAVEGQVVLH